MGPNIDRTGVEILTNEECDHLLRSTAVGRVGFIADGDVVILPVTHGVDGGSVVFRTAPGEKLDSASLTRPCCFEIDDWDASTKAGWSVLVKGTGEVVYGDDEIARLESLGVEPWAAPETRSHWVRIVPNEITGRRVG